MGGGKKKQTKNNYVGNNVCSLGLILWKEMLYQEKK